MSMSGSTSHCEAEVRAGQRKAAKGKEGALTRTSERVREAALLDFLGLRRGLCGEGLAMAIVTASMGSEGRRASCLQTG